jgi:hypothetical protein
MLALQVFFLFFMGLCLLAAVIRQHRLHARFTGWSLVEATIESSELVDSDDGCEPRISYRYTVGARQYLGSALFPGGFVVGASRRWAEGIVQRFPVGSHAWVWVDPSDPAESTLGMSVPLWALLLFWGGGIGSMAVAILLARQG